MQERFDTAVRDRLARRRTELANERTLLAYIRTALGFVIVGVPALLWLEEPVVQAMGAASLVIGIVFLGVGIRRFVTLRTSINQEPD